MLLPSTQRNMTADSHLQRNHSENLKCHINGFVLVRYWKTTSGTVPRPTDAVWRSRLAPLKHTEQSGNSTSLLWSECFQQFCSSCRALAYSYSYKGEETIWRVRGPNPSTGKRFPSSPKVQACSRGPPVQWVPGFFPGRKATIA